MELDQLKLFSDLVREQSFTKVAEKNFLTQPAVSLRIQKLEEELDTKLLERTTRKVIVTEEGRILNEYAREILRQVEEAKAALLERQQKMVGTVRLATVHSVGLHELPVFLKAYINCYPQVGIHIDYQLSDLVYHLVQDGDVDIGIVAYPEPRPNLVTIPFLEDELVVICNPQHSLAAGESVRLRDLQDAAFIAFEEGIPTRRAIDAVLKRHGIRIQIRMQCDNIEILKKMVEVGLGISVVPAFSVQQEIRHGTLKCLPISNYSFKRPLGLIHRKGKTLSRPLRAFIELLTNPPEELAALAAGPAPIAAKNGR
jgi:LysR family transcriptional regulator, transcriptional activator of the cysJI operon